MPLSLHSFNLFNMHVLVHLPLNLYVACLDGSLTMATLGKANCTILPLHICITLHKPHNSYRIIKSDQIFSCNNVQMQKEEARKHTMYLLKNMCPHLKDEQRMVAEICLLNTSGFGTSWQLQLHQMLNHEEGKMD